MYLDEGEHKALIGAASDEVKLYVRALCLLPLRPGALAGLTLRDFDERTRTSTISKDKTAKPCQITLPPPTAAFLVQQVNGKLRGEPIFSRTGGKAWGKDACKYPIKDAVKATGLPDGVSAYTLRHSVLTDLIRIGLPILTVAQISDTSVAMLEKHNGHLVRDDAEDALATLVL